MALSSSNHTKSCSNLGGKVRVIARIRGFTDQELASDATHSKCMISVCKSGKGGPFEKVKLSFDFDDQTSSRKNEYDVDQCYEQNEDTAVIFSREIKPQISRVFDGENSTFIAYGARDSGKTYTIQGSEENFGLGMLVMDEFLKLVEDGKHRVTVSIYEVFQDHVYDLLDPKNPEVQVLEDHGKIMLKGLSKVPVKSLVEFQKLYFGDSISYKPTKKISLELPRRSHKALMINILACDEGGSFNLVGKMNFVDLAGYENTRRNTIDRTNLDESTQIKSINKSLNGLFNVIYALNANESRVPFRESKLARVLQDSLGGNNHISMLFCLNPLFCPDTIHAATLASRLKNIKPLTACTVAKKQTSFSASISSKKPPLSANKVDSKTKQLTNSRLPLSAKKINTVVKGRNLFGGTEEANGCKEQTLSMENNLSSIVKPDITEGDSIVLPCVEEDASVKTQNNSTTNIPPGVNGDNKEKENNNLLVNESQSPPLSVKLKEMSNYLKSLNSSTPLSLSKLPYDANTEVCNYVDSMEPRTPIVTHNFDVSNSKCQSGSFSKRSTGLKQALVQNYLHFLNTATEDELKGISGIKEKRASYILELRENSPEPFKSLDDLQELGLSAKQVNNMMKDVAKDLFS